MPKLIWREPIETTVITSRGINYWESKDRSDRRIIIAVSNQLQELDARTGVLIESFGNKGYVDLRVGLGRGMISSFAEYSLSGC